MKKNYLLLFLIGILFSCSNEDTYNLQEETFSKDKMHFYGLKRSEGITTKAVGQKDNFWYTGTEIKVKFLNDPYNAQEEIKSYVKEWEKHANIKFKFVTGEDAHVRIGFDWNDDRYITWSYIGTDCKKVTDQSEATMSFAYWNWLSSEEKKGDVLRAFGHVLGLEFEHRHLKFENDWSSRIQSYWEGEISDIPWNNLRKYVFDPLEQSNIEESAEYDDQSIMVWPFPRGIGSNTARYANLELSSLDKEFIKQIYPFEEKRQVIASFRSTESSVYLVYLMGYNMTYYDGNKYVTILDKPRTDDFYIYADSDIDADGYYTINLYGDKTSIIGLGVYDKSPYYGLPGVEKMDISQSFNLENLLIYADKLKEIDLKSNKRLETLDILGALIKELDITENKELLHIQLRDLRSISYLNLYFNNKLTDISFENCDLLEDFLFPEMAKNRLQNLAVKGKSKITRLDLSKFTYLRGIDISWSNIQRLDINPKNRWLDNIIISGTPLINDYSNYGGIIEIGNNLKHLLENLPLTDVYEGLYPRRITLPKIEGQSPPAYYFIEYAINAHWICI